MNAAEARAAWQATPVRLGAQHPEVSAKRFIVRTQNTAGDREEAAARFTGRLRHGGRGGVESARVTPIAADTVALEFANARNSAEVADSLAADDYAFIEPDFEVQPTVMPMLATNDTQAEGQWAHPKVHSAEAWDISRGNRQVTVAVLDTGVDVSHPDLAANVWTNPYESSNGRDDDGDGLVDDLHGWNFADSSSNVNADDKSFHGTHVAGTIGAVGDNGIGISGHAQVVKLLPIKFIAGAGSGYTSDAIRGIDYAIAKGARIISNSWGSNTFSQALSDAISRARAAGVLFVAAAGNDGSNDDQKGFYPAGYPQDNIVSVAATERNDELANFSNYGATTVDLASPGVSILSTKNGGQYQYMSGTSMATPLVSGVLATMIALRPDLSYRELKAALLRSVDVVSTLRGKVLSQGRINSYRALSAIRSLTASPSPTPDPDTDAPFPSLPEDAPTPCEAG